VAVDDETATDSCLLQHMPTTVLFIHTLWAINNLLTTEHCGVKATVRLAVAGLEKIDFGKCFI